MESENRELSLSLFGAFEARCGGVALSGLQKRDGERLLALLAFQQGRPVKTELLAQSLWAASGSLDSLHQSVSHLRRELAEQARLIQSPKGYLLLDLAGVEVDVIVFDTAIAAGDIESLKTAISLYRRGTLLAGWDEVRDAWILPEREKRKRKYLEALKKVAADCLSKLEHADATNYLRAYVALHPSEERGWCDLMRALVLSRERVAAINLYEKCRSVFQSRYKIEPPSEMLDILRLIHPDNIELPVEPPQDGSALSVPRGVLALKSPYYIVRSTDRIFADAIARRESVVLVQGPRQTGKTSLLARSLQQARASGANVVLTDLQSLSEEHWVSTDAFCKALAQDLADQLDLSVSPAETWNPARGPNRNLQRYLRDIALEHAPTSLVWGIDEADKLFAYPFSTEIFALFRSWHNARALEPQQSWDRLTIAIAYATEVHFLIQDLNQSPFNVGLQLTLQDFAPEQVEDMNVRYGSPLSDNDQLLRFCRLLGGSPYLVHRGLYEMVTQPLDLTALEAQASLESGCFGDHLQRMEQALLQDVSLYAVARGFLEGRPCPTSKSFYRLKSAGLLMGEDRESAAWRSAIYKNYLEAHPHQLGL